MNIMPNSALKFCNRIFTVGGSLWLALCVNAYAAGEPPKDGSATKLAIEAAHELTSAEDKAADTPSILDVDMSNLAVAGTGYEDEPQPYDETRDARKDVDDTLFMAKMGKKNAIVVMGANWCHDSRGLAAHFLKPRFQTLFEESYEVVYVDMGIRNRNLDIAADFGIDKVEGTPTVIVVNAAGDVINLETAKTWRNADSRTEDEIFDEFKALANPAAKALAPDEAAPKALVQEESPVEASAQNESSPETSGSKQDVKTELAPEDLAPKSLAPKLLAVERLMPKELIPEGFSGAVSPVDERLTEEVVSGGDVPEEDAPEVKTSEKLSPEAVSED